MTTKKQNFPEKLIPLHAKIVIKTQKPLGPTANVFVHEKARVLPLYNERINCKAKGVDADGKKIAVNTVGRWLFGVPGFQRHVRVVPEGNTLTIYYPEKAPKIAHDLLSELKQTIEGANN
jgi:hypothetical protein